MSAEYAEIDPHILEDPEIAKQAIIQLIQTKAELEDIIDTFEMLSDPEFRKSMDEALAEVEKGETVIFKNTEELKRFLGRYG